MVYHDVATQYVCLYQSRLSVYIVSQRYCFVNPFEEYIQAYRQNSVRLRLHGMASVSLMFLCWIFILEMPQVFKVWQHPNQ